RVGDLLVDPEELLAGPPPSPEVLVVDSLPAQRRGDGFRVGDRSGFRDRFEEETTRRHPEHHRGVLWGSRAHDSPVVVIDSADTGIGDGDVLVPVGVLQHLWAAAYPQDFVGRGSAE